MLLIVLQCVFFRKEEGMLGCSDHIDVAEQYPAEAELQNLSRARLLPHRSSVCPWWQWSPSSALKTLADAPKKGKTFLFFFFSSYFADFIYPHGIEQKFGTQGIFLKKVCVHIYNLVPVFNHNEFISCYFELKTSIKNDINYFLSIIWLYN